MLASAIGQIGHPFYVACAWLLASLYALIPNYAIAIALSTVVVMIVMFPITLRGTRGMMKTQLLAPEIRKLQAKYKAQPNMSIEERQELRQRQQQELMALYKENNINPASGCLPLLVQFPVFIVLYGTIRGLIHQSATSGKAEPLYIGQHTKIHQAITTAHGQLMSFGVNLAHSVRTPGLSLGARVPFILVMLVAIALQYVQMKQMNGRNPAAAANPQMQQMQKVLPLIFAIIYISIPAGVNLYFVVSSLFRIVQQEVMYRRDPHIQASLVALRARTQSG